MLTHDEAARLTSLIVMTDWKGLPMGIATELADLLRKLNSAEPPKPSTVAVPLIVAVEANAMLRKHRDACHMYRDEHLEVSNLVNAMHNAIMWGKSNA